MANFLNPPEYFKNKIQNLEKQFSIKCVKPYTKVVF